MIVSGWSNGSPNDSTGGGYGIEIDPEDRDKHFRRTWTSVIIELNNEDVVGVTVSPSFWRGCPELRRKEIGKWMLGHRFAPWKGKRPRFRLELVGDRRFRFEPLVSLIDRPGCPPLLGQGERGRQLE